MPDIFVAKRKNGPKINISSNERKAIQRIGFFKHNKKPLKKIFFSNQKENEEIILFLRSHIATNFPWAIISLVLIFLPILLTFFLNFVENPFPFITSSFITVFILFYYLIIFAYIFINFLKWFYNIMIVTNLGVVDIDYSGLLYHDVAFTKLNLIEDVTYNKIGFLRSFFNFGDLFIQTAGEKENLEALSIPNPDNTAHIIMDAIGKEDEHDRF